MYLDERSDTLLKELLRHPDITGTKLQEKFNLSRRQVDYSFKKINNWLEEQGHSRIHRGASGRFITQPDLFQLIGEDEGEKTDWYIPSERERASLIILMLITKNEELSLNHFISELEVSKNTVLRDLKLVQQILARYHLEVKYTRMNGYLIVGDEWNKRTALLHAAGHIIESYGGEEFLRRFMQVDAAEIENLRKKLEQVEIHLNLHFIDSKMQILPYILEAIFRRISRGQTIQTSFMIDSRELSDTREYGAAEILFKDQPKITEEERMYITLQLLTSNVLPKQYLKSEEMPLLKQALREVLAEFERKAVVQLVDKEVLLDKLFAHIKPAYYRIKYHLTTDYSILDSIDQEFQAVHYIVKESLKPLEDFIGAKVPENESIFITLFIGGHLIETTEKLQTRLKAVVVCPNGLSISKLMEKTLRNLFPEIFFYQAMSIREFEHTNVAYDLVFSAVPLATDKKIFLVGQVMDEKERLELRQRVMRSVYMINDYSVSVDGLMKVIDKYAVISDRARLEKVIADYLVRAEDASEDLEAEQGLADLMPISRIKRVDQVENWQEAIKLAAEPLHADGSITEGYIDEMLRQYPEPNFNIILRKTIAIPHAETEKGVQKLGMSLLYIEKGLPLEDGSKLHFVAVIAAIDKNAHFKALLGLMELAGMSSQLKKLAKAENSQEMHAIIKTYTGKAIS
ncbi:BglG family transcription antiterminator [Listeria costaricensis]|uniref:BglG family transcription antiterminator n=1 Tax=Listeria costaricensis TaxID=2026604 RepID=UPI000C0874CB|nr:BglG family transcription antiterminator [Listeria costaricensis]